MPQQIPVADVALLGVATHKLGRLIARDTVTSFLRAPFTRYEGPGGVSEVNERPRGTGVQRALGELIACPICVDVWVGASLLSGWLYAPRATRLVASLFGTVAIADGLQLIYAAAQDRAT